MVLTMTMKDEIVNDRNCGMLISDIAEKYGISKIIVSKILNEPEKKIILKEEKPTWEDQFVMDWDSIKAKFRKYYNIERTPTKFDNEWKTMQVLFKNYLSKQEA